MGCFNLKGCISQLPIECNDRVVGIICAIDSSLNRSNGLWNVSNYEFIPACPIIYGTYDDYGSMYPESSKTTEILEGFFKRPIKNIVDAFSGITYLNDDNEDIEILKPLLDLRRTDKIYTMRMYNIDSAPYKSTRNILQNHWCILLEHESVIKEFIDCSDKYLSSCFFSEYCTKPWYEQYDEQLEILKEYGLNKWNPDCDIFDVAMNENRLRIYPEILFPLFNSYCLCGCSMFRNELMMDLFQNYPSLYENAFNTEIKNDYVDTLKFYFTLLSCRMKMNIDIDCGYQWENQEMIQRVVNVYKNIIDNKVNRE